MRTTTFVLALLLAGALTGGCSSGSKSEPSAPSCRALDAACSLPSHCCSGACDGTKCIVLDSSTCGLVDASCGGAADKPCCTGACENGTCVQPAGACSLLDQPCASDGVCCSGNCPTVTSGARVCAQVTAPSGCEPEGSSCTTDSECCSTQCSDGRCTSTSFCKTSGTACASDTECCSLNCPGAPTPGATCSSAACRPSGSGTESACGDGSQCCSGICSSGHCAAVPAGSGSNGSCTTVGEACTASDACCSTNCQGGTCLPASYCNAPGDICWRSQDCCSGLCTVSAGSSVPGRCEEPSGSGCNQDGAPCDNDSNCCTRKCVDLLGTGAKVCQPAGGCRMTGNYCDSTASCCGGTDPANPSGASPYNVECELGAPPKDNRICTAGTSCNPPGNICGGSGSDKAPASQNCCNDFGSGKDVCRPDMNGIMRCFGSPSTTCTNTVGGYDGGTPGCCIPEGDVCQFRDQCCDYAPCVPDGAGVLRCSTAASACLPHGASCTIGSGPACCSAGDICKDVNEIGTVCAAASCRNVGLACTASTECCAGSCVGGFCQDCTTTGLACTTGAECCTGICTAGQCGAVCVPQDGVCTATSDCCPVAGTSVSCVYQPGATSGTCKAATAPPPTCAATGQPCDDATMPCCAGLGNECNGGVCGPPPAPLCSSASQACATAADCCRSGPDGTTGEQVYACHEIPEGVNTWNPPPPVPCTSGNCSCEACAAGPPPESTDPYALGEPCSTLLPCCLSSQSYCANPTSLRGCTSTNTADCRCMTVDM